MTSRTKGFGMVAMAALLLAGCVGGKKAGQPVPADAPVVVEVSNQNWNTVVVYAVTHGQSIRLGDVATGQTAELRMPAGLSPSTTDFRLVVDPIGARGSYSTDRLLVQPGDRVVLRVSNPLGLSTFTTRGD